MTRVSLKEAYDNKDVVAQIYAIRDTAESAEDSAEQAVTTANTASDHVDALVPQVEGAVQNANSASASAQASAQTVAGYENRLATVEDVTEDLSGDLNAVTLRVTTAEGQIVTIQGRVTALETADGQNIKLTGEHAIGNYAVLLTGNQDIYGTKKFLGPGQPIVELSAYPMIQLNETSVGMDETGTTASGLNFYRKGTYTGRIAETTDNGMTTLDLLIKSNSSTANKEGRLQIYEKPDNSFGMRFWNGSVWTNLVS